MLTFLAICSHKKITVDYYQDDAIGYLEKNEQGKLVITRVQLRPQVRFAQDCAPSPEELDALHHQSHEDCFLANSVNTRIEILALD